jgi:tellurite resistance protein
MDLAVFAAKEVPMALGALKTVALADGKLAMPERQLLEVIGALHDEAVDVGALAAISPRQVARAISAPHRRKRVLQLAVVTALADGEVGPEEERALQELARALDIEEPALGVVHAVARDQRMLARLDMGRRLVGRFASAAYEEEGLAGLRKLVAPVFGTEDADVAWRYRELGLLPEGTLGRVFWEHCTRRHFAFPGEKGGLPERGVFHDWGHVLAGYDTDPEGEIQQGAFQAGFLREDGFAFLLFVMLQFHLGIRITPIAQAEVGLFDAHKVMRAVSRGAACRADLSLWNPWEHVARPLDEVRADLGIPPLGPDA